MFKIIPSLIIIISLAIIIVILVKKTPRLKEIKIEEKRKGGRPKEKITTRFLEKIRRLFFKFNNICFRFSEKLVAEIKKIVLKKPSSRSSEEELEKLAAARKFSSKIKSRLSEEEIIDLLEQASTFFGQGNFKAAEEVYLKIISKDPKNTRAYKGIGKIYFKQGNLADARSSFEHVLSLKPGDSEAKELLEKVRGKEMIRERTE